MRLRTSASQAWGLTPLSFADSTRGIGRSDAFAALVGTGKQVVFSPQSYSLRGTFCDIIIKFVNTVFEIVYDPSKEKTAHQGDFCFRLYTNLRNRRNGDAIAHRMLRYLQLQVVNDAFEVYGCGFDVGVSH